MAGVADAPLALACLGDQLVDDLAADLGRALEATGAEVTGGQAARLVHHVDEDSGAVGGKGLAGHGVGPQRLGEGLGPVVEKRRILGAQRAGPRIVHHDGLEALGAHDGAQAATARVPARPVLHVVDGDARHGHLHLARRADAHDSHLVAVALPQQLVRLVHSLADQVSGGDELGAVFVYLEHGPLAWLGLALHHDGLDAQVRQLVRGKAAGVGLLDAAGQRALAAHREAARRGRTGARYDARRDDQLVVRPQGMAIRRDLLRHDGGGEAAASQVLPAPRDRLESSLPRSHVHPQYGTHCTTSFCDARPLAPSRRHTRTTTPFQSIFHQI